MLTDPNCQLLYPFQNQANDYSGHARHGTVNGSGVYATRPNGGRCLYFDGVGDYVETPSFALSGTVVVFAADARCKFNAGLYQTFIDDNPEVTLDGFLSCVRPPNSNDFRAYYTHNNTYSYVTATDYFAAPYNDVWFSVLLVFNFVVGGQIYFYRNATLFSTSTMLGTPRFPSATVPRLLGLGAVSGFQNPLTDGYLANVQLRTLATMPAEAQMLANANRLMLGLHPIWSV